MASRPASILERILAAAALLAILLFALQLWYVRNARVILKEFITEQSDGRIKLELSKLDINLFSKRLTINEATLSTADSLRDPISYHVHFNRLSLNVGSVWSLFFRKTLLLDSIKLYDPVIQVMQLRTDTTQLEAKDELSIPQEMGKFYNSMLTALDAFSVKRIYVDNARISLINKMKPEEDPVTVSNIFFDLARTPVTEGNKKIYVNKNESIELRTSNQDIAFPDGRHHLSFKSLHLRLFTQRIDLDSCTVTATATDSLKSNYRIFFKKLSLTGVDFAAMSRDNIIKADTVYCENPLFDINLYRSDAVTKTDIPDADKIIRDLTGNLNLAFIGVKNAGIHFDFYGKTKQSFNNSNKDNFEIRGLRINPDSTQPVSIQRFDMTFKDYRYYNEDSSSTYGFGSLQFLNSRITLNNFVVQRRSGKTKIRNEVTVSVPAFELSALDWYQLIFEQKLVASTAVLHQPVFHFIRKKQGGSGRKINVFSALQTVDSLVSLANVSVLNGQLNMELGPSASLNVQDLDFNIHSNKLLRSTNKEGVRNAVEWLSFSKGVLRFRDITAELTNARFTDENLIYADQVALSGQDNKIAAIVNGVYIENMQIDDKAEVIDADRFEWRSAHVTLKALPAGMNSNSKESSRIHLKNVTGNNTMVNFSNGPLLVSTYVDALQASSIIKEGNAPVDVEGFIISGNNLFVKQDELQVNAASYQVTGTDRSTIKGLMVHHSRGRDSLNIRSSDIHFTTSLNDVFGGNLHFSDVDAEGLIVKLNREETKERTADSVTAKTPIRIDKLVARQPVISVSSMGKDGVSIISIPWSDRSRVEASGILIADEGFRLQSLLVHAGAATLQNPTGQIVGVEKGNIEMDVSGISYDRSNGKTKWNALIKQLSMENENGHLGNPSNKLRFEKASLGNIRLSSDYSSFAQLMKANLGAWAHIPTGVYADSLHTIRWYNAHFNNANSTLQLDSFVYGPSKPLDVALDEAPYQMDYLTFKTGAVAINGFDAVRFQKDSLFIADSMDIHEPMLTVFRDKKPPVSPNKKARPVPVQRIKNISFPLYLQKINLANGTILYSEKSSTTRKNADILFTQVDGDISLFSNTNLSANDSLSITLRGRFLDSVDMNVALKQSYTDSLSGFRLSAALEPAEISFINPVLAPLANAKILSGTLDSMSFRVSGTKEMALGEMDMHYRNLRIRLVDEGDPGKSTMMQHVRSFMANTFMVKNNNSKRTGTMYQKRSANQSFVNYLVKLTLSGVSTSIGLKKNKKLMKQYREDEKLKTL